MTNDFRSIQRRESRCVNLLSDLSWTLSPAEVVKDIHRPLMNGIELTAALKDRLPDIIMIGLSMNGLEERSRHYEACHAIQDLFLSTSG